MELYSLEDISGYTNINSDTLLSRAKTLCIKPFNKRSQTYLYTRSQAGCIIGNYTYSNDNEFLILESKLCNIE
jgi:hypothetical protein